MIKRSESPLRVIEVPSPVDEAFVPLLSEPMASAYARAVPQPSTVRTADLRARLLGRVAAAGVATRPMITSRPARLPARRIAPGVRVTELYERDESRPLRAGEPLRAQRVELDPGSRWQGPGPAVHREWLVLRGEVTLGAETFGERDYHVEPAQAPCSPVASASGAVLFLRESLVPAHAGEVQFSVRDAEAGWPDYAPGIRRRVLWQRGGQAALLYRADPGACVPLHGHGHDEECLMLEGELFLDDVLLQVGDYQLAPAGSGHCITMTDTGAVIYAHGDLDLQFVSMQLED